MTRTTCDDLVLIRIRIAIQSTIAILLFNIALLGPVYSQDLTPLEAKAIAAEAYVYGFPIVENYKTMYAYAIDSSGNRYKAPFNSVKNEAYVFTPADTTVVTPNSSSTK